MNASLMCVLAVLSGQPEAGDWTSVYQPTADFASAIRGQTPGYDELPNSAGAIPPTYAPSSPMMLPSTASPPYGGPFSPVFGFYAGYENVFVRPYFSSDAAFEFDDGVTDPDFQRVIQFDWDLQYTPRVWVGYVGPGGIGAQIRYWQFDHGETRGALDGGAGFFESGFQHDDDVLLAIGTLTDDSIFARHDLELHVVDVEGTWHNTSCAWGSVRVSGGVRYVRMDQDYGAKTFDDADPQIEFISSHHDFEGIGPTVAVLARRRIGLSNFALFASGRLSAVYGDASIEMRDVVGSGDAWAKSGDDLISVMEMQLGAEWWMTLWPTARLFVRAALEGQVWYDAGTGLNTASAGQTGMPAGIDNAHQTSPQIGDLGFFGFSIATGLTY